MLDAGCWMLDAKSKHTTLGRFFTAKKRRKRRKRRKSNPLAFFAPFALFASSL
jgi:hypothetical protein